jgi:hypothetical protein
MPSIASTLPFSSGSSVTVIDTAGLRTKNKPKDFVEASSASSSFRAARAAHVTALVRPSISVLVAIGTAFGRSLCWYRFETQLQSMDFSDLVDRWSRPLVLTV